MIPPLAHWLTIIEQANNETGCLLSPSETINLGMAAHRIALQAEERRASGGEGGA